MAVRPTSTTTRRAMDITVGAAGTTVGTTATGMAARAATKPESDWRPVARVTASVGMAALAVMASADTAGAVATAVEADTAAVAAIADGRPTPEIQQATCKVA